MTTDAPETAGEPVCDETVMVPPVPVPVAGLAWSLDDTDPTAAAPVADVSEREPWRTTLAVAAAILVIGGAAAWVITTQWGGSAPSGPHTTENTHAWTSARTIAPPTLPRPATGPRPLQYDANGEAMVPMNATPEELQQVIVSRLDWAHLPHGTPAVAAADAQSVCEYLIAGHHTVIDLFLWVDRTRPAVGHNNVGAFSGVAIGTYCRQYGYLFDNVGSGATS